MRKIVFISFLVFISLSYKEMKGQDWSRVELNTVLSKLENSDIEVKLFYSDKTTKVIYQKKGINGELTIQIDEYIYAKKIEQIKLKKGIDELLLYQNGIWSDNFIYNKLKNIKTSHYDVIEYEDLRYGYTLFYRMYSFIENFNTTMKVFLIPDLVENGGYEIGEFSEKGETLNYCFKPENLCDKWPPICTSIFIYRPVSKNLFNHYDDFEYKTRCDAYIDEHHNMIHDPSKPILTTYSLCITRINPIIGSLRKHGNQKLSSILVDDTISINITNYEGCEFIWEFNLEGKVKTIRTTTNRIKVSARDLFGDYVENAINKIVNVRVRTEGGGMRSDWSDALPLNIIPSSPNIESITLKDPIKCRHNAKGTLVVKLNRDLNKSLNEYGYIMINRSDANKRYIGEGKDTVHIEFDSFIEEDIDFRIYTFSKKGTENIILYNGGRKHNLGYSPSIPEYVTAGIYRDSVKNIYCYGGKDGEIPLFLGGGLEKADSNSYYNIYLEKTKNNKKGEWIKIENILPNKQSSENNNELASMSYYVIGGLEAGKYRIFVESTDGCPMRNDKNDRDKIDTLEIEIKEPKEAINIERLSIWHPLEYGESKGSIYYEKDSKTYEKGGYIEYKIMGGTRYIDDNYNGINIINKRYNFELIDDKGEKYVSYINDIKQEKRGKISEMLESGDNEKQQYFRIKINELPAGNYQLKIWDRHWEGSTQKNNCIVESFDTLIEPKKIELSIKEENIVSCNGYKDAFLRLDIKGGMPIGKNTSIIEYENKNIITENPYKDSTIRYEYTWYKGVGNQKEEIKIKLNNTEYRSDSILKYIGAGKYTIHIRDGNCIEREIEYELKEPKKLEVELEVTKNASCSGSGDGSIISKIKGGYKPYKIHWQGYDDRFDKLSDTVSRIGNLIAGKYIINVVDSMNCSVSSSIEVVNPEGLRVEFEVIPPSCHNKEDGRVIAHVKGGKRPYKYNWDEYSINKIINDSTIESTSGKYFLNIIDANKCISNTFFEIPKTEKLELDLGEDVTICKGQSLVLDPKINTTEKCYYKWYDKRGNVLSQERELIVKNEGIYRVNVLTEKGCEIEDTIQVYYSQGEHIDVEFTLPVKININKEVEIINITHPEPKKIKWIIPQGVKINYEDEHRVKLEFEQEGYYDIQLLIENDDCKARVIKKIFVDADSLIFGENNDDFLDFMVYPNPVKEDVIYIKLEFDQEMEYNLYLFSMGTGGNVNQKNGRAKEKIEEFNVSRLASGMYIIMLQTSKGIRSKQIIVVH